MSRRRRGSAPRCRLVSVAWLVPEDQVVGIVSVARSAGFSVSVSPTVHVVSGGRSGGSPGGAEAGGPPSLLGFPS